MNYNFAGKITKFILNNHPLVYLILIASIFAGIAGYVITPKQYNPTITLPAFMVVAEYPGATAREVELFVTKELEEKIQDIPNVDSIQSISIDGGLSIVSVQFDVGSNVTDAKTAIQTKLDDHASKAIHNIRMPQIVTMDPDSVPILTIGVSHPSLSQSEIREHMVSLTGNLKHISGVANINVHGGEKRALLIDLDLIEMEKRSISIEQVRQALSAHNILAPLGHIKDGFSKTAIEIDGRIRSERQASDIFIAPKVQLGDIADITDGFARSNSFVGVFSRHSDHFIADNTVFISLAKQKGENSIIVVDNVQKELKKLSQTGIYSEFFYKEYRNTATVAEDSILGLGYNLLLSIFIVSLVLFLFLGFRPALLIGAVIPLTLGWVFFAGLLAGETINRITLFALILSLGLLVDSATVVIENIFKHKDKGENVKDSVINGVNEVGVGLFLSTITSVIVFLPTSQITGMMGEYMGPLSFFVPIALIVSLLIAYIITPFLAYLLLKNDAVGKPRKPALLSKVFNKLSVLYADTLERLLNSDRAQKIFLRITFSLLALAIILPIIPVVYFKMLPTANMNQFYVYIDATEGSDIQSTMTIARHVSSVIKQDKEVDTIQFFVGELPIINFDGLFKGANLRSGTHQATLRVNLNNSKDRSLKSEEIVFNLREQFSQDASTQDILARGTTITVLEDPPGPPVQATFVAKIHGEETKERDDLVDFVYNITKDIEGLVDVKTSTMTPYLTVSYSIDTHKATKDGISVHAISQTLKTVLQGTTIGQYFHPNSMESGEIILHVKLRDRDSIRDLSNIRIPNSQGVMVPIQSLLQEKQTASRDNVYRDDARETVYITGEMQDRSIVYAVIGTIIALLDKDSLPFSVQDISWNLFEITYKLENGEEYSVRWGGEWEMTLENFRDLGLAMMMAFFLIFTVLVAQFKSFTIPKLIMITIPLSLIGILPGFALLGITTGTYLTATSLIGFIALMGIVVNNAILLLENIQQEQRIGTTIKNSLIIAGRNRLRPIILTSATTILGSLTIINDPVWSGLAWSIIFGLSLSVIFTLGVFPILYYRAHKKK